jgi:hypothetical protein
VFSAALQHELIFFLPQYLLCMIDRCHPLGGATLTAEQEQQPQKIENDPLLREKTQSHSHQTIAPQAERN